MIKPLEFLHSKNFSARLSFAIWRDMEVEVWNDICREVNHAVDIRVGNIYQPVLDQIKFELEN